MYSEWLSTQMEAFLYLYCNDDNCLPTINSPFGPSHSHHTSEVHLSRHCAMSRRIKVPGVGVG